MSIFTLSRIQDINFPILFFDGVTYEPDNWNGLTWTPTLFSALTPMTHEKSCTRQTPIGLWVQKAKKVVANPLLWKYSYTISKIVLKLPASSRVKLRFKANAAHDIEIFKPTGPSEVWEITENYASRSPVYQYVLRLLGIRIAKLPTTQNSVSISLCRLILLVGNDYTKMTTFLHHKDHSTQYWKSRLLMSVGRNMGQFLFSWLSFKVLLWRQDRYGRDLFEDGSSYSYYSGNPD